MRYSLASRVDIPDMPLTVVHHARARRLGKHATICTWGVPPATLLVFSAECCPAFFSCFAARNSPIIRSIMSLGQAQDH